MLLGLCFSLGLFTLAASSATATGNLKDTITLNKKDAFVDPESGLLIIPLKKEKNKLVQVNKHENLDDTQNPVVEEMGNTTKTLEPKLDNVRPADYREYWVYTETLRISEYDAIQKVSSGIKCPTPSCSISKTVQTTVSASFSTSASIEKEAIIAGASFTWQYQLTDQSTYQFNLNNGDSGYIGFKPLFNRSAGVNKLYSNWDGYLGVNRNAWGMSPKKTSNGEADGYYVFVFTDY
ncbi:hypothetical protein BP422_24880 [Brevibacillus formosus]|uniref:Uncharacterized protein n=1 Tax=Brevibacillus formosus TaxID=54913 RepID=A0A220MNH1_9BACL|nr:hypothetical protein [Brevibacillus formosus]ASJ56512.1 hypothetical protein BP422_24880 [Brevibacillus formosus]